MKLVLINKRIIFILLGFVTFILITGEVAHAQWLAPGKLTKSHKELEGLKNCTKCHQLGKGILNSLCMSCHEKLIKQIKENKGFHSRLKEPCIECHTDHKGEDYNITVLDKDKFDHGKTGYDLKDKHKTSCDKCHIKEKTFLGLNQDCTGCHTDVHKKALSGECLNCHDIKEWNKTVFDHEKATYKLTGKHTEVKCDTCHKGSAVGSDGKPGDTKKEYSALNFKPLKNAECNDCHFDIHMGELKKKTCTDCHTTEGWEKKTFEHNNSEFSDFRLEGKHEQVACDLCHMEEVFRYEKNGESFELNARRLKPVKHGSCNDCHYDVHKEQFKEQRCDSCHTVKNEWKKPVFSHESEEYKGFKLAGKHKDVECKKCHEQKDITYEEFNKKKKAAFGQFKSIKSEKCSDCHYDVHKEQFKDQRCDSCHTVENEWKKTVFTHESEKYKGFKLEGKHKDVECIKCHEQKDITYQEFSKKKKAAPGQFASIKSEKCDDCHYDVHKEQFRDQRCDSCHTVTNEWKKPVFSHESEEYKGYKLEGKHKEVECNKCHEPQEITYEEFNEKKKAAPGKFALIKSGKCDDCHYDVHKEQFKEQRCDSCHTVKNDWKKPVFSHESEEYKGYKLEGKHNEVECKKCHKQSEVTYVEFGKTKETLIGQFIPTEHNACVVCHEDKHKGQYMEACSNCHSPRSWEPKSFLHDPFSLELRGAHKTLECVECHRDMKNFKELDSACVSCHQNQDPHLNQFGPFCEDCHRQQAWIPTEFKHTGVGFRLAGGHRAADCSDCHINRDYRNTSTDCAECHIENYPSAPNHLERQYPQECDTCHNPSSVWASVSYDHSAFTFRGAHNALRNSCATCHDAPVQMPAGTADDDCYNCHTSTGVAATTYEATVNPSHSVLNFSTTCTDCHTVNSWAGADYAHQSLSLNSLHSTIDCTACHSGGYPGNYAGGSQSDCYTCHQSDYNGASNHTNFNYPQDCTICHSGNSWSGATFQHQNFQRNGVHAALDCTECHASGYPGNYAGASEDDCYTCHASEYQGESDHVSQGYPQDCTNCHSGNDWDNAVFQHQSFQINSIHSVLDCADCHVSGFPGILAGTTEVECHKCHSRDFNNAPNHANFGFSQDCTTCHSGNGWLNASYTHQSLSLNSLHTALVCTDCHASGYPGNHAGASQSDCYTCHQSDYNGAANHTSFSYPQDCTTCHSGNSWLNASFTHQSFNPNSLHTSLSCTDCHASGYPGNHAGASQSDCYTCHQSDYNGAANHTSFSYPQDCTTCHSGNSWFNASFTHQSFNPNSLHTSLSCTDCHASGYPGNYAGASQSDCYTCHQSDYSGATNHTNFSYPQDCTNCHSGNSWLNASFTHQSFNPNSLHTALVCTDCHASGYPGNYAGASQSDCYTCHQSDYNGATNHTNFSYPQDCTNCHSGNSWLNASFTHQSFNPNSLHISLACTDCHASGYPGNYAGALQSDCYTCHQSDYNGATNHTNFSYPQDCTNCHSGNSWINASFTHQSFNPNSLHTALACTDCHASGYPGNYAGTSQSDCYTCHQSDYSGALNHTNFSYPQDCTNCHSGNSWSGASFSHQSFNPNSLHTSLICTDCHASGYPGNYAGASQSDCYTCHQSDYSGALNHTNFSYPQDCTQCHAGNSWLGASFTHQSFQLRGIHTTLSCIACHASGYPGSYAGTSDDDCFACHESDYYSEHTNKPHDCTQCHDLWGF